MDSAKVREFEAEMKAKYGDDFNPVDIFSTEEDYIEAVEDGTAEEKVDNFFDYCADDDLGDVYDDLDDPGDPGDIEFDALFREEVEEDDEDLFDTVEDY